MFTLLHFSVDVCYLLTMIWSCGMVHDKKTVRNHIRHFVRDWPVRYERKQVRKVSVKASQNTSRAGPSYTC
jgi:ribulose 1,5-bisphosphate synthetase/thiazole synthase